MTWLSGLVWCTAGICTLGATGGVLLYVFQDKLLYVPQVPIRDPDDNPIGERCLSWVWTFCKDIMVTLDALWSMSTLRGLGVKNSRAVVVVTEVLRYGYVLVL